MPACMCMHACMHALIDPHTHTHTHTYTHIQDLIRISVGIEDINDLIADLRYVGVSRSLLST